MSYVLCLVPDYIEALNDKRPPRVKLLFNGPGRSALTLVLAHGAGMKTDFMKTFAGHGIRVCRFEFPYMSHFAFGQAMRRPASSINLS